MNTILTILFLVGSVSSSILFWRRTPTFFHANGTLYCGMYKPWCFHVSMFETDYPFGDDRIDFFGTRCTSNAYYPYDIKGIQTGDGLWNEDYELTMYVSHNCTRGGDIRRIERVTKNVPLSDHHVNIVWNVNVADLGEFVDYYA
uniref:Chitin-binding type-4 domain-containing protein n=1 Tax=Caenorhabditis tropicalis TaxID=1561998 RepID=A0A1I7TLL6_9PELO